MKSIRGWATGGTVLVMALSPAFGVAGKPTVTPGPAPATLAGVCKEMRARNADLISDDFHVLDALVPAANGAFKSNLALAIMQADDLRKLAASAPPKIRIQHGIDLLDTLSSIKSEWAAFSLSPAGNSLKTAIRESGENHLLSIEAHLHEYVWCWADAIK